MGVHLDEISFYHSSIWKENIIRSLNLQWWQKLAQQVQKYFIPVSITNNHFNIYESSLELWSKWKNFAFEAQSYYLFKLPYVFALMHMKIDTHYVFSLPNFPIFIGNVWNPIIIGVIFLLAYPLFKCIDQSGLTDFIKMRI